MQSSTGASGGQLFRTLDVDRRISLRMFFSSLSRRTRIRKVSGDVNESMGHFSTSLRCPRVGILGREQSHQSWKCCSISWKRVDKKARARSIRRFDARVSSTVYTCRCQTDSQPEVPTDRDFGRDRIVLPSILFAELEHSHISIRPCLLTCLTQVSLGPRVLMNHSSLCCMLALKQRRDKRMRHFLYEHCHDLTSTCFRKEVQTGQHRLAMSTSTKLPGPSFPAIQSIYILPHTLWMLTLLLTPLLLSRLTSWCFVTD